MQVEVGDEEAVVGGDQSHLLRLAQHSSDLVLVAVEDDMDGAQLFYFQQDLAVVISLTEAEFPEENLGVGLQWRLDQLLEPEEAVVVLVEDGQALPAEAFNHGLVGLGDEEGAGVQVD